MDSLIDRAEAKRLVVARGWAMCRARQGGDDDCTPYLSRGMSCPDCPCDIVDAAAEALDEPEEA